VSCTFTTYAVVNVQLAAIRTRPQCQAVHERRPHRKRRRKNLGVDALRERQRAGERAERALDAVVALAALVMLGLALAGHREDVVLELDVDISLAEPGEVGPEHEVRWRLEQIHRRRPAPRRAAVA